MDFNLSFRAFAIMFCGSVGKKSLSSANIYFPDVLFNHSLFYTTEIFLNAM